MASFSIGHGGYCTCTRDKCSDDCRTYRRYKPKPITNADRIRSMSDEELAEFFEMIPHCGNPATYTADGFCIDDGLRTKRQWLDWLKQEVTTNSTT